jgi:methylmalonyl-CoA mutase
LLDEHPAHNINFVGGGGGVITLEEIAQLAQEKTAQIYSPELGQDLGLAGMIGHIIAQCDRSFEDWGTSAQHPLTHLARAITLLENRSMSVDKILASLPAVSGKTSLPVLGFTGTGGSGKSSLLDELLTRWLLDFPELRVGVICVDPTKKKTGGALLGDRIRINAFADPRVYLRSLASRSSGNELAAATADAVKIFKSQNFNLICVETSGIGQGDSLIQQLADLSIYVMTPEFGAPSQLEKIDMLDFADFIVVNKYERRQGLDAVRDIEAIVRRTRFAGKPPQDNNSYPVFGTIANRFNDDGTTALSCAIVEKLQEKKFALGPYTPQQRPRSRLSTRRSSLIAHSREHYLSDISRSVRNYHEATTVQEELLRTQTALQRAAAQCNSTHEEATANLLRQKAEAITPLLDPYWQEQLQEWAQLEKQYRQPEFSYKVRNTTFTQKNYLTSLSQQQLPRVAVPHFEEASSLLHFLSRENLPGYFPYTAGIFPFRRQGEDPRRQFAGEGGPKRTNTRFHFLAKNDDAKRLSTAFDSVTLYGSDPARRPDIYGKVGESGVSIAHLDDMKTLYSGFDLCHKNTSVSMTINGPAPIILAMFFNTAIDQEVERFKTAHKRQPNRDEYQGIFSRTLQNIRGTVQADILKEEQAQNTCIFSLEFALKMQGDIQEYFIANKISNFYAVSISGYHIAEAGANPITQLAFTLANGFTYVEYFLARGFKIDEFSPNLSFFFSNGLDAEYAVIGRVARRIWAIALRDYYGASERAQKLKYHIQTSGRSLHASEMSFNDIRTTLQALLALYDNCNSLHTNAFDEALTTPTEASVRQAMAIQLIINREFGPNQCENFQQGSYFVSQLTDLVEEAVLKEFERISTRGGVLGAIETQYQRNKIQEESMYYEHLKHSGELPLIGVNTFLTAQSKVRQKTDLIRSSYEEKDAQLAALDAFHKRNSEQREAALQRLAAVAMDNGNIFAELMATVRYCSLGEISETLYRVGGKYRRSL